MTTSKPHAHPQSVSSETVRGPSEGASVVADIGGRIGAAAVYTTAQLCGSEIEIRPVETPWTGRHSAVRARRLPTQLVYAAFFDSLEEADYELRLIDDPDEHPAMSLSVRGGAVVSATWPDGPLG
jgi:hypothetical protein